ncbi:transposase [Candidatus Poribacteria bacterium]|nr:transposase [Candidatus Poribacteria bacterium]
MARHLTTLAMLISGIVGSKRVHLPAIASKVPTLTKAESRVKRFYRWVANERVDFEAYYLPCAQQLLKNLAHQTLVLIMDGSSVGRNCRTLMLSVVYKKRALPIAWLVACGSRGHFAEEDHMTLIEQAKDLLPQGAEVMFLGDGEFDGIQLQAKLDGYGFGYVCRTAKDTFLTQDSETLTFEELRICPGTRITMHGTTITRDQYGPITAIAWWDEAEEEPLYLISNLSVEQDPCDWYEIRFTIETFFSDQKSRGFHLHKSHLSDPQRLAQLMIAICLAYIWIVYLGTLAMQQGDNRIIHRTDRCDLSLFQLGLRLLEYFLNQEMEIHVAFLLLE